MFKILLNYGRVVCVLLCCICSSLVVSAQSRITGKVTGADDRQPVIGASVRIKGTTVGTVTDANGNFTISATPGNTLVVSYIGYQNKEVIVGSQTHLNVVLAAGNNSLNEIVVTGYTAQRKKDISGSVAIVDVNAAKQIPTSSSDQLLQGQAPGVTVVTQGTPGGGATVFVRGISNFNNSQPLYVIDGVQTGSMNDVNPNDIESINVLKDAGAAAIYGVAGGNGVVVITTKKGKAGKSTISYDGYYGTQRPKSGNVFNILGADEYTALLNKIDPTNPLLSNGQFYQYGYQGASAKGYANAGNTNIDPSLYRLDLYNPNNDYLIQKFATGAGTDWFHAIFKPAPEQSHTISASGANEKNNYYFSLGYLNQQGTLIDTYYKRYQARVNTNFNIKNHIRIGESGQVYATENPGGLPGSNLSEGNAISMAYRAIPNLPVYDIAGNFGGTYDGEAHLGNGTNPVAQQYTTRYNHTKTWNIVGTAYAEADITKYLVARTSISSAITNVYYYGLNFNPYWYGEQHGNPNNAYEGSQFYTNYNWTNTLKYSEIFGKHNITVLAGYEQRDNNNRNISGSGNNLPSLDPAYFNISNTLAAHTVNSGVVFPPTSTQSFFARLDYIFNDKYILGATYRRDGYSAFYPGQQWGSFPSVSLAWRISQEAFLKNVTWLNDLKLRGSYGTAGLNANVGGLNAYTLYNLSPGNSYYSIDGSLNTPTVGFYNTVLGNRRTSWETDKIANVGFDATILNSKFDLVADYFVKNSSDLLFQLSLPATVGGASPPFVNIGSVRNSGFELGATFHGRPSSDFSYNIGLTATAFKNTITGLNSDFHTAGSRIGSLVYESVGHPMGSFYGYQQIGYFSSAQDVANSPTQPGAAPGAFKFADLNHDGKITDADRTFIGNPNPKATYGLNLNANYKGFDLTMILYGSYGNKNLNYVKYWTEFYTSLTGNKSRDLLYNSWSPSNLNPATVSPTLQSSFSTDQNMSTYYVESGSFLKCRVFQVGYSFKPAVLKYVGVDKLHLYVQATNLFTITKYTGLDPELQASAANGNNNNIGIDYGGYPNNQRTFLVGANLTF